MLIGDIVKQYRTDHGLTTREFAERAGVSNAYITMLETRKNSSTQGEISPTLITLNKLARAMNITLDELISQVDNMHVNLSNETALLSPTEEALILRFRCLNDDEKRIVLRSVGLDLPHEGKGAVG